jgi:hypothetical protein
MTRDRSLVIIFDDAHWGDASSLLLLQHVAHMMACQRLLILVNHRDTEPLDGVLVTELAREPVTRELAVSGRGRQGAAGPPRRTAGIETELVQVKAERAALMSSLQTDLHDGFR